MFTDFQALVVMTETRADSEWHTAHVDAITTSGTATALSDVLLERVARLSSFPLVQTLELMEKSLLT